MPAEGGTKKEVVPSDPIPSLALRRHARHRTLHSKAPGASPFRSPKTDFPAPGSMLAAHRGLSFAWSRSLVAAFRSPATAAPSRKPPFRGQRSRPATSRPTGSSRRPVRPGLPCLHWFAPVEGSFFAPGPLRFLAPARSAASSASTPLRDFYLPRDRSVQQFPPPRGSPSKSARFPLAPRRFFYL